VALLLGPLRVKMEHAQLIRLRINYRTGNELTFRANSDQGRLWVVNEGSLQERVQVGMFDRSTAALVVKTNYVLSPGESWRFPGPNLPTP
jgi:hypothetical protein